MLPDLQTYVSLGAYVLISAAGYGGMRNQVSQLREEVKRSTDRLDRCCTDIARITGELDHSKPTPTAGRGN